MTFDQLKQFLNERMRMSHIYQPVMIKRLLSKTGNATDVDIANELLKFDPSQIEYYQNITNNMVGKVLRSHKVVDRNKREYFIPEFDKLSQEQISELILICESKIDGYIKKRGDAIWSHRKNNREPVSGTIRYEVLKRARFRCELCGISADEKALEVDHITPKNLGGEDSINNYQALCYSCNSTKRDRDNADLRDIRHKYDCRDSSCLFCNIEKERVSSENNLSFSIRDKYPVTPGHTLIIPKRHFQNYFEITQSELNSVNSIIQAVKTVLEKEDPSITAFNIGINSGADAGQTVMHTHIHLIPRRRNDIAQPIGGVRNLIPGKGNYMSD